MALVRRLARLWRRAGARFASELSAPAEVRALHRLTELAESVPRYKAGRAAVLDYNIHYVDALTFQTQWNEIFVRNGLQFLSESQSPRILDCGANIGLATLYLKRAFPAARITAFEADPAICAVLAENLRTNGAGDVEVVNAAVWKSSGHVDFRCDGADSGSVADFATLGDRQVKVPAVRLRDILESERIDLLKLDIEGAEAAVLEDCRDAMSNVRALVAEFHEFDEDVRRTPELLQLLASAGYDYALTDFCMMPWRGNLAPAGSAFAGTALSWAYNVRAWRRSER